MSEAGRESYEVSVLKDRLASAEAARDEAQRERERNFERYELTAQFLEVSEARVQVLEESLVVAVANIPQSVWSELDKDTRAALAAVPTPVETPTKEKQ